MATKRCITRIHGIDYDLEGFEHPGGPHALGHSYGRDATVLFESMHPFVDQARLRKILAKYRMLPSKAAAKGKATSSPLLLEGEADVPEYHYDSAFAKDLKERVDVHFAAQAASRGVSIHQSIKATSWEWLRLTALHMMSLTVLGAYIYAWSTSTLLPAGVPMALGLLLGLCLFMSGVNVFHDGAHFSLSTIPWLNHAAHSCYFWFCSSSAWYHSHNIAHHAYTNVVYRDSDLHHGPARKTKDQTHLPRNAGQEKRIPMQMLFTVPYQVIAMPIRQVLSGKWSAAAPHHPALGSGLDKTLLMLAILAFGGWQVTIPWIASGIWFGFIAQMTHVHDEAQTDVDITQTEDWYKTQVETATNCACDSWWWTLLSGRLNYQIEHHLFPTVNSCHLKDLRPIVMACCKKHSVRYVEFANPWANVVSFYKYMKLLGHGQTKKVA